MKKIFVSYSHADEKWKDRLVKHLKVIQNQNQQSVWDDSQILAGGRWRKEIETVINAADGAILLISADFLTSEFILKQEVPRLLKRWENDEIKIFPLIVEHCAWDQVDWLNKLQHHQGGRVVYGGDQVFSVRDIQVIGWNQLTDKVN